MVHENVEDRGKGPKVVYLAKLFMIMASLGCPGWWIVPWATPSLITLPCTRLILIDTVKWHVGQGPLGACLAVKHKGLRILLDPCLDLLPFLHFLPQPMAYDSECPLKLKREVAKGQDTNLTAYHAENYLSGQVQFKALEKAAVDFGEFDVVLLSHWKSVMALPLVTEYSNFKGKVYTTVPTMVLGGQVMEELVALCEKAPYHGMAPTGGWATQGLGVDAGGGLDGRQWQGAYTLADVHSCLGKIQAVSLDEVVNVYGIMDITATSSGLAIGSCNWVLGSSKTKVFYMAASSPYMSRHPCPFNGAPMAACDTILLAGLSQQASMPPQQTLDGICRDVGATLRQEGSVLFPVYPTGNVYDLMETLHEYLCSIGKEGVPFYFISAQARPSLVLSNIFSEWLSNEKGSKVFMPECPFSHEDLVRAQRLHIFSSVHDLTQARTMKEPCIVFVGHPSLRCGDGVHFMQLWRNNPNNLVVLTEPEFPMAATLAPYQPMALKAKYCPMDARTTVAEASVLLQKMAPRLVACPSSYIRPPSNPQAGVTMSTPEGLAVGPNTQVVQLCEGAAISLPTRQTFEPALMHEQLADKLQPRQVSCHGQAASMHALLDTHNNRLVLKELGVEEDAPLQSRWFQQQHLLGMPAISTLVLELRSLL
eukprot:Ihof_evm8s142 gene=Ihof_evmTU8s142